MTYSKDGLLILGKGILTDELHNLSQLILSLEDLTELLSESHELWGLLLVELVQGSVVVGEGNVPVHRWEMLSLGKLLIQSPENRDNGKSGGGNWIGEITTWWGDGTDNRDGTLTVWGAETSDTSSTLVELSEGGTQVGWETRISGHLSETSRDLSEGLGPSGGGVSHHSHIRALISEVLGKGDTSVNGGLTSSDWHVRGVSDEAGTLHDVVLLSIDGGLELGEVIKYLSHLVSTLTTSDVDDTVGVGVLGEGLGDTGLTAAEGSWNGASSSLHSWEESVEHTLSSQERGLWSQLLGAWTWGTDRPEVRHGQVLVLSVEGLNDGDGVGHTVAAWSNNFLQASICLWLSHNFMLREEIVLKDMTKHISTSDEVTNIQLLWLEVVHFLLVEAWQVNTTWDEN